MRRFKDLVRRPAQEESSSTQRQPQQQQQLQGPPTNAPSPQQQQASSQRAGSSYTSRIQSQPQPQLPAGNSRLQFSGVQHVAIEPQEEHSSRPLQFSQVYTINSTSPKAGPNEFGPSLEDRQEDALLKWINSKDRVVGKEPERRFGLVQQYPNPSDKAATAATEVDIIAIHGLGARSPNTWIAFKDGKTPQSGKRIWLEDVELLPKVIPTARILCYDWPASYKKDSASQKRFDGHAATLLQALNDNREREALLRAEQSFRDNAVQNRRILNLTIGAVFLGTPFKGSWEAGYAIHRLWYKIALLEGDNCSPELIQYLRSDRRHDNHGEPSPLTSMIDSFAALVRDQKYMFPIMCFFEEQPAKFEPLVRGLPDEVLKLFDIDRRGQGVTVPESSATLDGIPSLGLPVRHNLLHKHYDPEDMGFMQISNYIKRCIEEADATLRLKGKYNPYKSQLDFSIGHAQRMAEWLQVDDFMSQKKQNDTIALRQPKTGEWLLNSTEFQSFKTNQSKTLFCPGISGAGKTVLTSVVVEHLARTVCNNGRSLMAYVYSSYDYQAEQTAEILLRALLKQLLQSCSDVPETVRILFRTKLEKGKRQPTLNEICTAIQQIAARSKVFLVIDALDELHYREARRFLEKVFDLQKSNDVRIFATSRNMPDIERLMRQARSLSKLPIRADRKDIARFIDGNIDYVSSFVEQQSRELKVKITETIANVSDGMFLLAQLHLNSLQDYRSKNEIEHALRNLDTRAKNKSGTDPADALNDAYSKTLERINRQKPNLIRLAKRVLTWLTFAQEPLTRIELGQAILFEQDSSISGMKNSVTPTDELLNVCAGLVSYEAKSNHVVFLHWTAKRYFETYLSAINDRGTNVPANRTLDRERLALGIHRQLGLTCLNYLSKFEFAPPSRVQDLDTWLFVYQFYRYASSNWGKHIRIILRHLDPETQNIIITFLNNGARVAASSQTQQYWVADQYLKSEWLSGTHDPRGRGQGFVGFEGQPDVNVWRTPSGSAMHVASSFGLTHFVKLLLTAGHPPDTADGSGMTPLCYAAAVGEIDLVRLLLSQQYHAYPLHESRNGFTPICWAASNGHKDVVQILLSVNTSNHSNGFAYSLAGNNGHLEVESLLRKHVVSIQF
ncbi:hypothetical protein NW768_007461 [Fusarium equiseti]|uniref:NACHT domain-containing protein n=1 Tax=Fusarium equiseti TaxID=61235 RepID=A0ABQ8R7T3_FUSEQ|nr:hypothetical protein NW768_007461 [Fusarium equiseti]